MSYSFKKKCVQIWHHTWDRTGTLTLMSREYKSPSLEQTDRNTHPIPHEPLIENMDAPWWEKHPVLKRYIKIWDLRTQLSCIFCSYKCPHDGSDGLQIKNQFRKNQDFFVIKAVSFTFKILISMEEKLDKEWGSLRIQTLLWLFLLKHFP